MKLRHYGRRRENIIVPSTKNFKDVEGTYWGYNTVVAKARGVRVVVSDDEVLVYTKGV